MSETVRYWRFTGKDNPCYLTGAVYREVHNQPVGKLEVTYSRAQCYGDFVPWTPQSGDIVTNVGGIEYCLRKKRGDNPLSFECATSQGGVEFPATHSWKPVLHRAPAPQSPPASATPGNAEPVKCPRCQKTAYWFFRIDGGGYACDACRATPAPVPDGGNPSVASNVHKPASVPGSAKIETQRAYIGAGARDLARIVERQRVAAEIAEQSPFTPSDTDGLLAQGAKFIKRRDLLEELAALDAPKPSTPKRATRPQPVRCGIWSREIF